MGIELPVATERLVLRRFAAGDLAPFLALRSDPEIARYQSWDMMTFEEAAAFVREQAVMPLGIPGRWCQVAVALRSSEAFIGDIGLFIREDGRSAELGFSIAREHQGRGYAREAVACLIELLFASAQIERMEAITDARNLSSIALLRRLGFELESTADALFKGETCQEHTFAISQGEWRR